MRNWAQMIETKSKEAYLMSVAKIAFLKLTILGVISLLTIVEANASPYLINCKTDSCQWIEIKARTKIGIVGAGELIQLIYNVGYSAVDLQALQEGKEKEVHGNTIWRDGKEESFFICDIKRPIAVFGENVYLLSFYEYSGNTESAKSYWVVGCTGDDGSSWTSDLWLSKMGSVLNESTYEVQGPEKALILEKINSSKN
jgi:hypothetical protein